MNFLFFFPDELSASAVSCYGNKHAKTPNLDRLAANGTLFENCFSQNPVCSPSRCAMMTGTYVHNRGHRTLWNLLKPDEPSLFRYLKQNGYEILWYGKNDLYSSACLDEICADRIQLRAEGDIFAAGLARAKNRFAPGEPGSLSFLFDHEEGGRTDFEPNVEKAVRYLKSRKKDDPPFFLYLPIDMPHPPYHAPEAYRRLYEPDSLLNDLQPPSSNRPSYENLIRRYRALDELSMELFAELYSVYLGSVSFVDALLGRLLTALSECSLTEDTVLLFSSDHGDWHGTRKLVEKWPNAMDDELLHVPLIISVPGGAKGHVVKEQTELLDLMATVLDLAGIPCRHTHFSHSLTGQLFGAPGDPARLVFAEGGYDENEPHCFEGYPCIEADAAADPIAAVYLPKLLQQQEHPESVCRSVMVRSLTHKLVRRTNGENELYDLTSDPGETRNLYYDTAFATVRSALECALLDWYLKTSDTVPLKKDARGF